MIALGIISSASATTTNEVHVTGSTAFRSNFFTAATASGGIFDAPGGTALVPSGTPSGSSSVITYVGNINSVPYALECSWSGSEAGIANVAGDNTLQNPGVPNPSNGSSSANLPGDPTTFPTIGGAANGFSGTGDLDLSDTSQAVSLTQSPQLHNYGVVGVVTFTWEKGVNSDTNSPTDAGDQCWLRVTNITEGIAQQLLAAPINANIITSVAVDTNITAFAFGRNAGSGTRANCFGYSGFGVGSVCDQWALNSYYTSAGVLTFNLTNTVANGGPYPTVLSCLNSSDPTVTPNFLNVGDDGYDSGAFVSDCMSCDSAKSEAVTIGYLGLSDASHARAGQTSTTPPQPGGAVYLTLDGLMVNDAVIINGAYPYWGHEHLYGNANSAASTIINNAAAAIKAGIASKGGLGTGSNPSAQDSGIVYADMLADKPAGGDLGYPVEGAPTNP